MPVQSMAHRRFIESHRSRCFDLQGGLCMYCGVQMTPSFPVTPTSVTLEHVSPRAFKRRGIRRNCKKIERFGAACNQCNKARGASLGRLLRDLGMASTRLPDIDVEVKQP